MAKDYKTEDGSRVAPLSELRDFEVAKGFPDIRGWRVDAADGSRVGKVHDLLVDVDSMRTRYLDVRLTAEIAAAPGDRDVLVPIGAARIDDKTDVVVLPLASDRIGLLPPYDHRALTRAHEYEVRRHFSLGQAAAAAAGAASAAEGSAPAREFYDDAGYDDRQFFSARGPARPAGERPADAVPDTRADASTIRVPVEPDDSVSLKRGQGGRDEVIIRRPRTDEDRAR